MRVSNYIFLENTNLFQLCLPNGCYLVHHDWRPWECRTQENRAGKTLDEDSRNHYYTIQNKKNKGNRMLKKIKEKIQQGKKKIV